jgi:ATP-binding protein involved in chromosome partitioning
MNIEKAITTLLATTKDTLLQLSSHEMGIKPIVAIENNLIDLNLCAGFPCHLLEETLKPAILTALNKAIPHHHITVTLSSFIKAHQTQLIGKGLRGVKNTIAVASGKGGVGKSTVTVNLATALSRAGARVGILDADIYGPSIPLMLGKTSNIQIKDDHYLPALAHGIQAMSIGYLTQNESALIWRGPMLAKSLMHMLNVTLWDDLDYLFIDLPPGTGDIQLSLVQKIPLTAAIIVTTPQTVATLDAQKALQMFDKTGIHVLGLIENMSQHTCSECGHQDSLFGSGGAQKLCDMHNCSLLAQLPLDSRITADCDAGTPTALNSRDELTQTFVKAALFAAIELSKRPLNYADKFPPIVAG